MKMKNDLHPAEPSGVTDVDAEIELLDKSITKLGDQLDQFHAAIAPRRDPAATRIRKTMEHGSIRDEEEFYLLRQHIDLIEGQPGRDNELLRLYELLETFATRRG